MINRNFLITAFIVLLFVFLTGPMTGYAQVHIENDEDFLDESLPTQVVHKTNFPLIFNKANPGQLPLDPIGPIGGTFTSVLTDPNKPNIVYGGHFQRGIFKSYDQGQTWNEKNKGLPTKQIQSLAIHPRHSDILYAGTYGKGVYLSRNGGDSWIPWNGGKLDSHIIYDVEIDRLNPSNVYVASRVKGSLVGYLYRSTDAGKTWAIVYRGDWFDTADYFYDVAVHPAGIGTVFLAAHEHGFLRSLDNGNTFNLINNGVTDLSARGFAFLKSNQNQVIGSVWKGSGAFRSWNKGNSWQQTKSGLPDGVRVSRIMGDPFSLSTNRVFIATFGQGIYNTANFGDSWVFRGLNGYAINDIAISHSQPQTWFLAAQDKGMLRTKNGGASWATVNGDLRLYTVTGMQSFEEDDAVYIAVYGQGVFIQAQGLDDWIPLNEGLNDLSLTGLFSDGKTLWATNDSGLWRYTGDQWVQVKLPETNVSIENFLKWQNDLLGIPKETLERTLEMRGSNQVIAGVARSIYVRAMAFAAEQIIVGSDDGVWKYSGNAWKQLGLQGQMVQTLAVNQKTNTIWASACEKDGSCGVWRFEDFAWHKVSLGLNSSTVNNLKCFGNQIFAAADDGIYRWQEDTNQWVLLQDNLNGFLFIEQNPAHPSNLIASGYGSVYHSKDFGETWRELATGADWHYQYVGFVPGDEDKILLGSRESGAFLMAVDK